MATWQWVLLAFVVLLPFSLMLDFWPRGERCDSRGGPLPRDWWPPVREAEVDEHH